MEAPLSLDSLRAPPHSVEAEQCVLGGFLLDNKAIDNVSDVLIASDFYRSEHRLIFEHIVGLTGRGKPADVITVFESLRNAGKLEEMGGLPYLNSLSNAVPSASSVRQYAEIIRNKSVLRQLAEVSEGIAGNCYQPQGKETNQILDDAERKIFSIAEQGQRGEKGFLALPNIVSDVLGRLDELAHSGDGSDVTGVPTGFTDLDNRTTGLQRGDLVIVAGRPSMGKTAFSLNMAEYVALEVGMPVAVFSMEMGADQLAMRMLASIGGIDAQKLRTGRLGDDDWARLTRAVQKIENKPLYIDETPALTPIDLRGRARRLARQTGQLGLIVIDYLQLMTVGGNRQENRATEISEISRSLKALAKELQCPVVALSQLNRSLESRTDKRPVMSDLRESGAIEQDADIIMFIYRDEVYNPEKAEKGVAEIIIGKQRNGPIGTVRLSFLSHRTRFEDMYQGGSAQYEN